VALAEAEDRLEGAAQAAIGEDLAQLRGYVLADLGNVFLHAVTGCTAAAMAWS
jgi:hypothetical protein